MTRWFNVAGPCRPEDHYMLSATERLPEVMRLVQQKQYFVLHAPRQTGKTTAIYGFARELNASGRYRAAVVSLETGSAFNNKPDMAESAILHAWRRATSWQLPAEQQPPPWPEAPVGARIGTALQAWAQATPLPHPAPRYPSRPFGRALARSSGAGDDRTDVGGLA